MNEPEVIVDIQVSQINMDVVWNADENWLSDWFYGWDAQDVSNWGEIRYPIPSKYDVHRYYLGDTPGVPHTSDDKFHIETTSFKKKYQFGYYDMLIVSDIDTEEQSVSIDEESSLDEITATTSISLGMTRVINQSQISPGIKLLTGSTSGEKVVTALYNQPEIFFSAYKKDIYISRDLSDYEWDEASNSYIKHIDCHLRPLVYTYLVQVVIKNNQDKKISGCTGNCAMANVAAGTSVNTGRTKNASGLTYYESRMKRDTVFQHDDTLGIKKGEIVDIIGGKLTTFGLCDMDMYPETRYFERPYTGSRTDLMNHVYVDLNFRNKSTATLQVDVTEQMQRQAYGGIITIVLDAGDIPMPEPPASGDGSLFIPSVDDYEEIVYEIIM